MNDEEKASAEAALMLERMVDERVLQTITQLIERAQKVAVSGGDVNSPLISPADKAALIALNKLGRVAARSIIVDTLHAIANLSGASTGYGNTNLTRALIDTIYKHLPIE